jgi:uncharacterized protein (TIGR02996 family)
MNVDASFIRSISLAPRDNALRLEYADWLEEQGDLRGEYLRLECQLSQMQITLRLAQLRAQIDPSWIALVGRDAVPRSFFLKRNTQRIAEDKLVPGICGLVQKTPISGNNTDPQRPCRTRQVSGDTGDLIP